MNKMILLLIIFSLSSCGLFRVHKMDIEQGNIITPETIRQIHIGMSEEQVRDLIGTPLLTNTFDNNRLDYVYTFKSGYGKTKEDNLTLIFKHGTLKEIIPFTSSTH